MESWYRDRLYQDEFILLSEKGFTNNQLGIRYLLHFIQHTSAGPDKPYKLLLMDNHRSHCTPKFISLAQEHNIMPFSLLAHLTHCIQPADLGLF
jgi:hypothetical protein